MFSSTGPVRLRRRGGNRGQEHQKIGMRSWEMSCRGLADRDSIWYAVCYRRIRRPKGRKQAPIASPSLQPDQPWATISDALGSFPPSPIHLESFIMLGNISRKTSAQTVVFCLLVHVRLRHGPCRPKHGGRDLHGEPAGRHDESGGDGRVPQSAVRDQAVLLLRSGFDHAGRPEDVVRQQRLRQLPADRRPRRPQGTCHGRHAGPGRDRPHLVAQSGRHAPHLSRRQGNARPGSPHGRPAGRQAPLAASPHRRRSEHGLEPLLSDPLRQELQGDLRQRRAVLPCQLSHLPGRHGGQDVHARPA